MQRSESYSNNTDTAEEEKVQTEKETREKKGGHFTGVTKYDILPKIQCVYSKTRNGENAGNSVILGRL